MKITNGKGVNHAIEATGVAPAARAAFTALAMRGVMVRSESGFAQSLADHWALCSGASRRLWHRRAVNTRKSSQTFVYVS